MAENQNTELEQNLETPVEGTQNPTDVSNQQENVSEQNSNTNDNQDNTQQQPTWPDDWRSKMAGGDEKLLKQLERYTDPIQVAKGLISTKQKLSEGLKEFKLSDNPTEEELDQYREARGIPKKPEEYQIELGDGLTIGDDDKTLVDEFKKIAHAQNIPPETLNSMLTPFFKMQDDIIIQRDEQDNQMKQVLEDTLRQEWGQEYRANINLARMFFDDAPESIRDNLLAGRGADGTVLANNPDFVRWAAQKQREVNPISTVIPSGAANGQSLQAEIQSLEAKRDSMPQNKWMRDDNPDYKRWQILISEQEKLKNRG